MALTISLPKTSFKQGETINVLYYYKNNWSKDYRFKIEFYHDGKLLKELTIFEYVPHGKSISGSFSLTASTPGQHRLKAVSYMYSLNSWVKEDSAEINFNVVPSAPSPDSSTRQSDTTSQDSVQKNTSPLFIPTTYAVLGLALGIIALLLVRKL